MRELSRALAPWAYFDDLFLAGTGTSAEKVCMVIGRLKGFFNLLAAANVFCMQRQILF